MDSVTISETLSIKYGKPALKTVTYDEVVEGLAEQNGMDEAIGTKKLAVLQSVVQDLGVLEAEAAQSGGQVVYYLLSQPVSIPEAGVNGAVVALDYAQGIPVDPSKIADIPCVEIVPLYKTRSSGSGTYDSEFDFAGVNPNILIPDIKGV